MSFPSVLPPSPPSTNSRKPTLNAIPAGVSFGTPEESSGSLPNSSETSSRKKVEFSPWADVQPDLIQGPRQTQPTAVRPIRPSKECQALTKSILKHSNQSQGVDAKYDGPADVLQSMSEKMESLIQQLSKDDKVASIDAYRTLATAFKVYDEVPDSVVLRARLQSLSKYIRRDLLASDKPEAEPNDTQLTLQAIKMLIIIVWSRDLAPLLTDEFRIFILDRSIQVVTDHTAPKGVIIHYLHLLATQDFRPNLIASNSRAFRLIDGLKELTSHVKGNGAVSERLMVYHRLLEHARPVMKQKAQSWIEEMLAGATSGITDTRSKAISLGMKAISVFPKSSSIAQGLHASLEREIADGKTTGAAALYRLGNMLRSKEECAHVPQIWNIVILLISGLDGRIDSWPYLPAWLKLIQKCFNCSDSAVRLQANLAWNRFVYVVKPHEAPGILMSMLVKPLVAQLERPKSAYQGKISPGTALSSYCNLLYYAFRPAATHSQCTRAWDEYIVKVITSKFCSQQPSNADFSCRVLMALLWNSNPAKKLWKEYRAHGATAVEPEELPTIDSKWIRSKSGSILEIFKVVLKHSCWGSAGSMDRSFVATAWRHFAKALGEACAKEIKSSAETTKALGRVIDFLQELQKNGHSALYSAGDFPDQDFPDRMRYLSRAVLVEVGAMPFIDLIGSGNPFCEFSIPLAELVDVISTDISSCRDDVGLHLTKKTRVVKSKMTCESALVKLSPTINESLLRAYHTTDTEDEHAVGAASSMAIACLGVLSDDALLRFVGATKASLCLWLEDSHRMLMPTAALGGIKITVSRSLISALVSWLGTTANVELDDIKEILAAGFRSVHKPVVSDMVKMWNAAYALKPTMTYPTILKDAITRLRPFAQLDLPGWVEGNPHSQLRPLPAWANSQDEAQQLTGPPSQDCPPLPELSTNAQQRTQVIVGLPMAQEDATSRNIEIVTPKSKLRHDDSQVVFTIVESSPIGENQESQYLTDRQKEIRQRQRDEPAAFFSDLRSSSDASGSFTKQLALKAAATEEHPETPTTPLPQQRDAEEILALSPTPRTRHQALRLKDIEIQSSPLSVSGDELDTEMADPPEMVLDVIEVKGSEPVILNSMEFAQGISPSTQAERQKGENMITEKIDLCNIGGDQGVTSTAEDWGIPHADQTVEHPSVGRDRCASLQREENNTAVDFLDEARHDPAHRIPEVTGLNEQNSTDSEEIDFMTASQLSQDLDRHVSVEDVAPGKSEPPLTVSRKRRRSAKLWTEPRKRKRRSMSRLSSNMSDHVPELEIFESVEVVAGSQTLPPAVKVEITDTDIDSAISFQPSPSLAPNHPCWCRKKSEETLTPYTLCLDSIPPVSITAVSSEGLPESRTIPGDMLVQSGPEKGEQMDDIEDDRDLDKSTDIMTLLRKALDQLKGGAVGEIDLRRVDDLCFHIRTEAQNVFLKQQLERVG